MVDIQTVSIAIASASVVAGIIYYGLQIRHQTRARHTDLVMRLYSTFGSREFMESYGRIADLEPKDYLAFIKQYKWTDFVGVGTFFEGIGVLLKRKLIDIELVDDLFSEPIRTLWVNMKPMIDGSRKYLNQPRVFEWFEYLRDEMNKREQIASKKA